MTENPIDWKTFCDLHMTRLVARQASICLPNLPVKIELSGETVTYVFTGNESDCNALVADMIWRYPVARYETKQTSHRNDDGSYTYTVIRHN